MMNENDNFPVTTPETQINEAHELVQNALKNRFTFTPTKIVENRPQPAPQKIQPAIPAVQRVIVIGAGVAGLVTAALLAKKGYKVTVLEKNKKIGGKKTMPLYTMPEVAEHLFSLLGEDMKSYFSLTRVSPSYRVFLEASGKAVDVYSDIEENAIAFEHIESGAGDKFRTYMQDAKKAYDTTYPQLFKNIDGGLDLIGASIGIIGKVKSFASNGSLASVIDTSFKDPTLRQILKCQALLVGTDPRSMSLGYSYLNYADIGTGVWQIDKGFDAFTEAFKIIGQKHDVQYFTDSPVKTILVSGGAVRGVELESGRTIEADIVISNADMHHTETTLLSKEFQTYPESYWSKKTVGPSAFVLELSMKEKMDMLSTYNILIPKELERSIDQMFSGKQFQDIPSLFITKISDTKLSVCVPVIAGLSYSKDDLTLYSEKILRTIEANMNIANIKEKIESMSFSCVTDFETQYNSYKGTIFGLSLTTSQTGAQRPLNMSKKVKGLYYVGADTNPGVSLPMCLISAELAYKRIEGIQSEGPLDTL